MNYRPEIDGLRALAVLPVILFHAGFGLFKGGFVGVDVFFVISGYLITSIILAERRTGKFSYRRFYERRARRILPALFLVMFASLPFAWLWLLPSAMEDFSRSLSYVTVFASNLLFYKQSGYFGTAAELVPLLHTWSLAVEEQFYIFFPPLVLLLWRFGRRNMLVAMAGIAALSLVYSQFEVFHKPAAAFFLLSSRFWELLVGALIARHAFSDSPADCSTGEGRCDRGPGFFSGKSIASACGILLVLLAVFFYDKNTPFPGVYALAPVLGTALVILFADRQTLAGKLLGSKPLVSVGLISYSAYLWHQPILAFARHQHATPPSPALLALLVLASLAMAFISWKYVERPFREQDRISAKKLLAFSLAGAAGFMAIGLVGQYFKGYESYFYANRLTEKQKAIYSVIKTHTGQRASAKEVDNGDCNFRAENIAPGFLKRFDVCAQKYGKAIVVLGDSHAVNIYNALYKAGLDKFVVGIVQGGCHPDDDQPHCQYRDFEHFAADSRDAIRYVLYHEAGSNFLSDRWGKGGSDDAFAAKDSYVIQHEKIELTIRYLARLHNSVNVVWLGPFAEARRDYKNLNAFAGGFKMNEIALQAFSHLDGEIEAMTRKEKFAGKYLSLIEMLKMTPDSLMIDGCLTFSDNNHLSQCGEALVGRQLLHPLSRL